MIDALTLIILGLATARLTTLIVDDAILEGVRHELFLLSPPPDDLERGYAYQQTDRVPWRKRRPGKPSSLIRRGRPPRSAGFAGRLVSCTHCVGAWVAVGAIVAWNVSEPWTGIVALVLAVAQLAELAVRHSR